MTPGRKYPVGTISYDLLMEVACLVRPGPFKLYVVLLVYCNGKTECGPARKTLAASMNEQVGAIRRWCDELIEANLLTLCQGDDGRERFVVKPPGEALKLERHRQEQTAPAGGQRPTCKGARSRRSYTQQRKRRRNGKELDRPSGGEAPS